MLKVLLRVFERSVRHGRLEVVDDKGRSYSFGDGQGELVRVRFVTRSAYWSLLLRPDLALGERYMDGTFRVEAGTIYDFIALILGGKNEDHVTWWSRLLMVYNYATRRLAQLNSHRRARRNVAHHYDLDHRLYELFLDSDWQYSCGYFDTPDTDLEEAQRDKKRRLAAKLALRPGDRVLDIGSGWGGLGIYLAERADANVTGVTLSQEQHAMSERRAADRGMTSHTDFRLQDYRELGDTFDRIVSVGMFEHVGVGRYGEYFNKCAKLLADDGVMVLHSIGRFEGPSYTNPWIRKYIFPGGYIPALSEVLPAIERSGLRVSDIEILRLHYAETLKAWRQRFMARWDDAKALYDERFCRMWEYYLAASEAAFRYQDLMVFQIQLIKDQNALPLTRRYMEDTVHRLRAREGGRRPERLAGE